MNVLASTWLLQGIRKDLHAIKSEKEPYERQFLVYTSLFSFGSVEV